MSQTVLLSTARGKDVNAKSLVSYLIRTVLTPVARSTPEAPAAGGVPTPGGTGTPAPAASAAAVTGTTRYRCARQELHCGNGGGVDVYLAIHNQHRGTFLEQSAYLYSVALEVCPQLSLSIIPVIGGGGAEGSGVDANASASGAAAASSASHQLGGEGIELYDDVAAILRQWRLVDQSFMRGAEGFKPHYKFVAVGGTFDHFHSGHKVLLSTAALHAFHKLRVGVTDVSLLTKKRFAESLQPKELRMQHVKQFLQKVRPDLELEVAPIWEMSGGTKSIAEVEALVVSPETAGAVGVINEMRAANGGLPPMVGISIPQVQSPTGEAISSTALRERLTREE